MREQWKLSGRKRVLGRDFYVWYLRDDAGDVVNMWAAYVSAVQGRTVAL